MKRVKTVKGYVIKEYNKVEQEKRNGYKYGIFLKEDQDDISVSEFEADNIQELIGWID